MTRQGCGRQNGCPGHETLDAYVDGECSDTDAERIGELMRCCAGCRQRIDDACALSASMRMLREERAPTGLWGDIAARLDAEDAQPGRTTRISRRVLAMGAIAASAAAVTGPFWLRSGPPTDVVDATVQDYAVYRARGWTVDKAARDSGELLRWAQERVGFAVPSARSSIGDLSIAGVRLCWLLDRRLLGLTYTDGTRRAVLYVMESRGLALPPFARELPDGRRIAVRHHIGHGVGLWMEADLLHVFVSDDPRFDELVMSAAPRRGGIDAMDAGRKPARNG